MNFEINHDDYERLFIYKGKSDKFIFEISDIFTANRMLITKDEAIELINYLQGELDNDN